MSDLLAELTAPSEPAKPRNWYGKLPPDVQAVLCQVRAAWLEKQFCPMTTLLERLRGKFKGMPTDAKRISEFIRNERNAYPEVTSDGADQGRTERTDGTGTTEGAT